jgi:hypothetical protein
VRKALAVAQRICPTMDVPGLIVTLLDWLRSPFRAVMRWVRRRMIGPLHLIPQLSDCRWYTTGERRTVEQEKEGMHLKAIFHVTNARADYAWLVATRLRKPRVEGVICVGESIGELRKQESGALPSLPPGLHRWADARFLITPSIGTKGEDFVADVVIVDNREVEHRRRVVFTPGTPR